MSVVDRREAHNQDVKRKILDAARELLLAGGVDGLSMRKLAAKIGYTATGIYHHFPDKQSVLQELMDADFKAFRTSLGRIGKVDDPIERIRKMAFAYIAFASENPDHYRLMFMIPPTVRKDLSCRDDPSQDAYAFLREAVSQGLAEGRFRSEFENAEELTQILWAGAHGLVSLHIAKNKEEGSWVPWTPLETTSQRMGDALLRGLAS